MTCCRFEGGWAAVIGDVVGKGAEAAALTALARHTLAAIVEATGDLAYALQVLNRRLRGAAMTTGASARWRRVWSRRTSR